MNSGSMVIHPNGKYLYAADSFFDVSNDPTVAQFSISSIDGSLQPMSPATIGAPGGACAVTVDPSGQYVYAGNNIGNDQIDQYHVDSTNGSLTATSPAAVSAPALGAPPGIAATVSP